MKFPWLCQRTLSHRLSFLLIGVIILGTRNTTTVFAQIPDFPLPPGYQWQTHPGIALGRSSGTKGRNPQARSQKLSLHVSSIRTRCHYFFDPKFPCQKSNDSHSYQDF